MSEITILSWKTASKLDSRTIADAEVDMQGISEIWAHAGDDPEDLWSVQMVHLMKGYRKKESGPSGRYITMSPLVTGYRKLEAGWMYSPKYVSPKWERFFVWEMMGSEEWLATLEAGDHYPTPENQLDKLVQMPPLVYRKPDKIARWKMQTRLAETKFDKDMGPVVWANDQAWECGTPPPPQSNAAELAVFEDHTRSCVYPTRCQFFEGCHGSREFDDRQAFTLREPHHGFESGQLITPQELLAYARGRRIVWLDRSRVLQRHRCPWSRYLEYHYRGGSGIRRKSIAIPLATGIVVHEGLAGLMEGKSVAEAVGIALDSYDKLVRDCGLFEDGFGTLDDQAQDDSAPMGEAAPFTIQEQRCMAEGLIRVANSRAVPAIRDWYEIESVEKEVWRILGETEEAVFVWQSRADAILRRKE